MDVIDCVYLYVCFSLTRFIGSLEKSDSKPIKFSVLQKDDLPQHYSHFAKRLYYYTAGIPFLLEIMKVLIILIFPSFDFIPLAFM